MNYYYIYIYIYQSNILYMYPLKNTNNHKDNHLLAVIAVLRSAGEQQ